MTEKKRTKSIIIPSSWKKDIDNIVEQELVGANRYFAEANPNLSKIVESRSLMSPQEFFRSLCTRWEWHHTFYEDILETALPLLVEPDVFSLTPRQIETIRETYLVSSLVDQATLTMSAAIKQHIAYWTSCLPECQLLSLSDFQTFYSLPTTPYPAQYFIDHISYIIARREGNDSERIKNFLIKKYHASDEEIFQGRMERFKHLDDVDTYTLRSDIEKYEYERNRWVKHFYLGIERPRIKAMMQSLAYDNNEEKQTVRELIGISGFVLRKEVLRYLTETKILPKGSGIYKFQDTEIEIALNKLNSYRHEVLDRKVTPFEQHGLTCSAACLTMIAAHFGVAELSSAFEKEVAEESKSNFMDGQHFSGVAAKAASLGLETILVHSNAEMFDNSQKWLPENLFKALMAEYKIYLETFLRHPLAKVESGSRLDVEDLKPYLENGYLIIAAGVIGGGVLHSIVLTGYSSEGYLTINPLTAHKRIMRHHELNWFMNTKIGRWIIAIRPDQSPVFKLEQELPRYKKEAAFMLL